MEEEVKSITKETYQNKDSFFSRNHRLHLQVSLRPYEFPGLLFSCPCDPFYWKGISMFVMSTGSVCYGLLRQRQEIHGGFKLIIQRDKERCWMKNQATQNLNSSKSLGIMNGIPLLAGWIPNLLDGFAWICWNEKQDLLEIFLLIIINIYRASLKNSKNFSSFLISHFWCRFWISNLRFLLWNSFSAFFHSFTSIPA